MSGRIAATLPLPFAASGLIVDIAEKLRLKSEVLSCGIFDELDELELLELLPLLPQAATTRAAHAATDVRASLLVTLLLIKSNETTSFVGPSVRMHKWPQGLVRLRGRCSGSRHRKR